MVSSPQARPVDVQTVAVGRVEDLALSPSQGTALACSAKNRSISREASGP